MAGVCFNENYKYICSFIFFFIENYLYICIFVYLFIQIVLMKIVCTFVHSYFFFLGFIRFILLS